MTVLFPHRDLVRTILAVLLIGILITAPLLTALVFMLVVAQLGPGPVMIPAVIWLYWKGSPGWGGGDPAQVCDGDTGNRTATK